MPKLSTLQQLQLSVIRIAQKLNNVSNSINNLNTIKADKSELSNINVDLSGYLTKTEAASTYATKDNLQIILSTDTSTLEGAVWLEWS